MKTKLSAEQVAALKRSYERGTVTQRELATQFGICPGQVSRIVNGKSRSEKPTVALVFQRIADGLR